MNWNKKNVNIKAVEVKESKTNFKSLANQEIQIEIARTGQQN